LAGGVHVGVVLDDEVDVGEVLWWGCGLDGMRWIVLWLVYLGQCDGGVAAAAADVDDGAVEFAPGEGVFEGVHVQIYW